MRQTPMWPLIWRPQGSGAKREKITEIGMVKVENGAVTDTYHTLVNPGRPIPEHITELTGIDDDMVKDAPMIQDVIGEVIAFCGTLPVLGHQIMFDYGFLSRRRSWEATV